MGCDNASLQQNESLNPKLGYEGLSAYADVEGWPHAISVMARECGWNPSRFFKYASFPKTRTLRPGDTIATFYCQFSGGGAENVQRMLVDVWRSMGFKVILLLECEPDHSEIDDLGIEYRIITNAYVGGNEKRIAELENFIEELDIKGIVYHQWLDIQLSWDMTLFKSRGLPFYIHCHGIFAHFMENGDALYSEFPWIYQHADGIVSLSEVDASYWRLFNSRTFVTMNQSIFKTKMANDVDAQHHRVLWLGRVSPEKRPREALDVFKRVLDYVPDARMDFVGGSTDPEYEDSIQAYAAELGIQNSVRFAGWSDNTMQYYRQARVFLMTSEPKEGFPLTLGECQALGIPCVMYDLPYLTFVRQSSGIRVVDPGDSEAAAKMVAQVLQDDKLYQAMRTGALDMARVVESFDTSGLWSKVLLTEEQPPAIESPAKVAQIRARVIMAAFVMGQDVWLRQMKEAEERLREEANQNETALRNEANWRESKLREKINCLEQELDGLQRTSALELSRKNDDIRKKDDEIRSKDDRIQRLNRRVYSIEQSKSFRIGRALTWLPRKGKKLVRNNLQSRKGSNNRG